MTTKRIIYEDGEGLTVVTPAPKENARFVSFSVIRFTDPPAVVAEKERLIAAQQRIIAELEASKIEEREIDEQVWLDFVIAKDLPAGAPFSTIEHADIPTDKTYRNAWRKGATGVEVDMPKARLIHMERIRKVRNKELEKSDDELLKALENGGPATPLKTKRQKLRDIPQTFDLETATTEAELKAKWPAELPRE